MSVAKEEVDVGPGVGKEISRGRDAGCDRPMASQRETQLGKTLLFFSSTEPAEAMKDKSKGLQVKNGPRVQLTGYKSTL